MTYVALFFLLIALAGCAHLAWKLWRTNDQLARLLDEREETLAASQQERCAHTEEVETLKKAVQRLAKWAIVADADAEAAAIKRKAEDVLSQAESDARILVSNAERQYHEAVERARREAAGLTDRAREDALGAAERARATLAAAAERSSQIIADAHTRAEQIAGKAYEVVRDAERYERTARAMKNVVEGYGDEYLIPASSLLDELAVEVGHKEAGQRLKLARENTKAMIKNGTASKCEYVESSRREKAERFVLDAFNGKVDSVLSRAKHDNYGRLAQEIRDAWQIVNHGGEAFRDARITDEFLAARLDELKWATISYELKRQEQEEQRAIRERMRDEERARREYERALRETAKEEEILRRAMSRAQADIQAATSEQRAQYEQKLAELQSKLVEVEAKSIRALSMAQQTKKGHVYIISNVGSFGENVYKIGLTRRLEPLDRIWELGDASVPFDFDIHAIILSEDAPALETRLHKHFLMHQVNKVNHRKEFFRANLADIRREIEGLGIESKWTMAAEAREYRESLAIDHAIQIDPVAREAWINRQLVLDPVGIGQLVEVADDRD